MYLGRRQEPTEEYIFLEYAAGGELFQLIGKNAPNPPFTRLKRISLRTRHRNAVQSRPDVHEAPPVRHELPAHARHRPPRHKTRESAHRRRWRAENQRLRHGDDIPRQRQGTPTRQKVKNTPNFPINYIFHLYVIQMRHEALFGAGSAAEAVPSPAGGFMELWHSVCRDVDR